MDIEDLLGSFKAEYTVGCTGLEQTDQTFQDTDTHYTHLCGL